VIILTGFGPYGEFSTNLSSEVVKELHFDNELFQFRKEFIPVSWKQSIKSYNKILLELNSQPELVILLGIHSGDKINLEKLGWNFKVGDDKEKQFKFGPIKVYSSPWIKTTLNLKEIYSNIEDKSDVSISYFPGLYLCNYLYYWALYLSKKKYPVLFIHIPNKGNIFEYVQKVEMILRSIIKIHLKRDLDV